MSKEIKVFSGTTTTSASSSTTLYTVPSGRVAKIDVSSLKASIHPAASGTIGYTVGTFIFSTPSSATLSFELPYVTNSTDTYESLNSAKSIFGKMTTSASSYGICVPNFYFLTATQTFVINNNCPSYTLTTKYNFSVVEEY